MVCYFKHLVRYHISLDSQSKYLYLLSLVTDFLHRESLELNPPQCML